MAVQDKITFADNCVSTAEVMSLLNYRSRQSFWQAVHTQGIPFIRINCRRAVFPRAELMAWLKARTVGGGS